MAGLLLAVPFCFGRNAQSPDVLISEFVASNATGLRDIDGDHSDWLELFNAGATNVNLEGWYLTDDARVLTKWRFPATNLPPNQCLIVFASDKNRATPGAELHTNFKLSAGGEYLALVRPDLSIAHAYAPAFPPQKEDASYGLPYDFTLLLSNGAPARWFVPGDDSLGTTWTMEAFDDSGWSNGVTALGFFGPDSAAGASYATIVRADPGLVAYYRLAETNGTALVDETGQYPGTFSGAVVRGFLGALGADTNRCTDFRGGHATVPHRPALSFAGAPLTLEAWAQPDITGRFQWLVAKESDNTALDYLLGLNPDGRFRFITQGLANDAVATNVSAITGQRWFHVVGVQDPAANTVRLYVNGSEAASVPRQGTGVTSGTPLLIGDRSSGGQSLDGRMDEVAIYRRALSAAEVLQHYRVGTNRVGSSSFEVATDLRGSLLGINPGVFVRVPFVVPDAASFDSLTLTLKYDDGFVAYLNGVEVARRNVPAAPAWNSAALAERSLTDALRSEAISLTSNRNLLVNGANVLAIHVLNARVEDDDLLVSPILEAARLHRSDPRYFATPTPGVVNTSVPYRGFVANTTIARPRGFYDTNFSVPIATITPGAVIRYTLDGSKPSETNGLIYSAPLLITNTTTLRAAASAADFIPSSVATYTYIFASNVVRQPVAPPGFPAQWAGFPADYAMDPTVVDNPLYRETILPGLKSLPVLSVVMPMSDLFGAQNGFYANSEQPWERETSIEFFDPADGSQFQIDCGARISGATTVSHYTTPKHSLWLRFRGEYGSTKLAFPLFRDSSVTEFDHLKIRTFSVDSWLQNEDASRLILRTNAQYARELWVKRTFLAMGQLAGHNRYAQLYLNGLYWGIYDITERHNADFVSSYLGGTDTDWDVIDDGLVRDGDATVWNTTMSLANTLNLTTYTNYLRMLEYINVTNLADYMILHLYAGAEDWDTKNWTAARRRQPGAGFIFLPWDQEVILDDINRDFSERNSDGTPHRLWHRLKLNPEFRLLVADRLHKHLFNDGALTVSNNLARFRGLTAQIDTAIVAESARWGDYRRRPPYTRNVEWLSHMSYLTNYYFPRRHPIALAQFAADGFYPPLPAPEFNHWGGHVGTGFALRLGPTIGTIYYTLDGSDPRLLGGLISTQALASASPSATVLVQADSPGRWFVPTDATLGTNWLRPDFDDSIWSEGAAAIGFETQTGYETIFRTDVGAAMFQHNATIYSRIPFVIAEGLSADALILRAKFDDGFVAYLNGREIARANAPAIPLWNSPAPTNRADSVAITFQSFLLTNGLALLVPGTNLLAIQALNVSAGNDDFLFVPELVAYQATKVWQLLLTNTTVKARVFDGTTWSALTEVSFVVDGPRADTDGDGMPDEWELRYGLAPDSAADGSMDQDNDGLSNRDEYLAGTDPTQPLDVLRVDSILFSAGSATLKFVALSNRTYSVQYRNSLAPGPWSTLVNVNARLTNHVETVSDLDAAPDARFYRLTTPARP